MSRLIKASITLSLLLVVVTVRINAQIAINSTGSNPDSTAMLDISSSEKGVLIPRMTTIAREVIAGPTDGLLVYDIDTGSFWYYENDQWTELRNSNRPIVATDLLEEFPATDFSCIEQVDKISAVNEVREVVIRDNYAFIIQNNAQTVNTVDISNPKELNIVATLHLDGKPNGMASEGMYLYVIDDFQDVLRIIDSSNPLDLQELGSIQVGVDPEAVAVANNYAYVVDDDEEDLKVIDVSDPFNLSEVGSVNIGDRGKDVIHSGTHIYAFSEDDYVLFAINVSDPTSPAVVDTLHLADDITKMAINGTYLYAVDDFSDTQIRVIDIQDPNNMTLVNTIDWLDGNLVDIKIDDPYLFVLNDGYGTIGLFDISDPVTPVYITETETEGSLYASSIAGNYAYIGSEDYFEVIQLRCNQLLNYDPLSGNLTTVTDQDNQSISSLYLSGSVLKISLENDGEDAPASVDLWQLNTDYQGVDHLDLNGTTLEISLDNNNGTTSLDLSPINTDNQSINYLNLNGTTLEISLDNNNTTTSLDLSPINTDNQSINHLDLNETTLEISLDNSSTASLDLAPLVAGLAGQTPIGTIQMWPTNSPPTGWLICNGASFSSSAYPDLATVLGGTTLPNFNGRFPLGVGNSGTSGSTQHNISSTGGEEKHQLTVNEMPSHNHGSGTLKTSQSYLSETGSGAQDKRDGGGTKLYAYDDITGNTASVGGNQSHNNMPPFYTINFIIKAE